MTQELVLKCRDKKNFKIKCKDLMRLDDFYIKNILSDVEDDSDLIELEIDEDYDIVKCIYDSLRYKTLVNNETINLKLLYMVCDKWCVPLWLIEEIYQEINMNKRLLSYNKFISNLTNDVALCKNCNVGFKINENKPNSCKTHLVKYTMTNLNTYACCNKVEPCNVGYHVPCDQYFSKILLYIKDIE